MITGKSISKSVISVLITLLLLMPSAAAFGQTPEIPVVYVYNAEFAEAVAALVGETWQPVAAQENFATGVIAHRPFQTCRLLVGMKIGRVLKDTFGAVKTIQDGTRYVLQYADEEKTQAARDSLLMMPGVEFVAVDGIAQIMGRPCDDPPDDPPENSDDDYNFWGTARVNSQRYIDYLDGADKIRPITIAVLDTGVDAEHPFLAGRLLPGKSFIEGEDTDGNGHGTHVSGTIVDNTPDVVKILPIKVIDDDGYGADLIIQMGVEYAIAQGADILNLSLGGRCEDTPCLFAQGVHKAINSGITVVAAAGNDNDDVELSCPANLPECITVTATDGYDFVAGFSNFGDTVDIAAPGVFIASSVPGGEYSYFDGTSMATPHVSAAAALLLMEDPTLTPVKMHNKIREAVVDCGLRGWDIHYGAGVLNLGILLGDNVPAESISVHPSQVTIQASVLSGRMETWVEVLPPEATDKSYIVTNTNDTVAVYDGRFIHRDKLGETVFTFDIGEDEADCEVSVIPSNHWIDYADDVLGGGEGSQSSPYRISTPQQLARLAYDAAINGYLYYDEYFVLTNDIDLAGYEWAPIYFVEDQGGWWWSAGFMGHFDGGGHAISNMKIVRDTSVQQLSYHLGLFGQIGDEFDEDMVSQITNLAILDAEIDASENPTSIDAGILAGYVNYATISNCFTTGVVSGGGLIGSGREVTVNNCYSTADVYQFGHPFFQAGAFSGGQNNPKIYNSYAAGNVVSNEEELSAFNVNLWMTDGPPRGEIVNSFSCGDAGEGSGFISSADEFARVNKCYYLADNPVAVKESEPGGILDITPKELSFFKNKTSYETAANWDARYPWDFARAWNINPSHNAGLPYLRSFERLFDPAYVMQGDADNNNAVDIFDILLCRDVIFDLKNLGIQGRRNLLLESGGRVDVNSILLVRDVIFNGA
ncbi:MAG: S8 family serine peptidase [Clostridia bacterium]|nr:S8 family serine peptidase [Clostridia bacterium]